MKWYRLTIRWYNEVRNSKGAGHHIRCYARRAWTARPYFRAEFKGVLAACSDLRARDSACIAILIVWEESVDTGARVWHWFESERAAEAVRRYAQDVETLEQVASYLESVK